MVSKSQIKLITSLEQKKHRTKSGLFLVEGKKGINEILNSHFQLHSLFTTGAEYPAAKDKTYIISPAELKKISLLKTPQDAIAIFQIPKQDDLHLEGLTLALDGIRDPGNLGTIIRLCDWFGIENLICSGDTVDCYNPKVVQATMGSITRVKIFYEALETFLADLDNMPILGTFLEGDSVYSTKFPDNGILILGNEANGISGNIEKLVVQKLYIPQFGTSSKTESLNVATATAIFLSEFRRQKFIEK